MSSCAQRSCVCVFSATDEAWRLLASYLDRYPSPNGQHYHSVIKKLLSHGIPLPDWLVSAYKVRVFMNTTQFWVSMTTVIVWIHFIHLFFFLSFCGSSWWMLRRSSVST